MRNSLISASATVLAAMSAPEPAQAEVVSAGAHGFEVRHVVQAVIAQPAAFEAFGQVAQWWSKDHTYSGDSANLSLSLAAGGCFCERLPTGGGVEHMRVAHVVPGERLVLTGSLGPLLYEATAGVMDVKVERIAGGSRLTMTYRAAGFANGGADKLAPLVDQVLGEQMARYRKFAAAMPQTR
ncbi:MAG TPA: ATPase [Sphingomicrobium sp.]|nr:ATPase [Sphingomicrobium sp.]